MVVSRTSRTFWLVAIECKKRCKFRSAKRCDARRLPSSGLCRVVEKRRGSGSWQRGKVVGKWARAKYVRYRYKKSRIMIGESNICRLVMYNICMCLLCVCTYEV